MRWTFDFMLGLVGLLVILGLVAWGIYYTVKKSYDPGKMIFKLAVTIPLFLFCIWVAVKMGPMGPFLIALMGVCMSFMWVPHLSEIVSSPLTNMFDGGEERPDDKPFYSIATAKRKRGLYHEAIAETRKQLKKFPNDFEGVMLLAGIYAENMKDVQAAENILGQYCVRPKIADKFIAVAWTTLADWHLKISVDVDAARVSLQKIIDRFPETELALRAEQRLAHLVQTEKILLEQHDRQAMALPEGVKNIGLMDSTTFLQPQEIDPGRLAAAHIKHLETHPHDSEVREKLAVIYATHFRRLDLATMELLYLINEPRHSPKQIAGWLNQLANFQVELGADIETVRVTLEAIVNRFPDLPLAEVTQRRLGRLNAEFKGKEKTPGVTLGVYEQNIGLKYGAPGKN